MLVLRTKRCLGRMPNCSSSNEHELSVSKSAAKVFQTMCRNRTGIMLRPETAGACGAGNYEPSQCLHEAPTVSSIALVFETTLERCRTVRWKRCTTACRYRSRFLSRVAELDAQTLERYARYFGPSHTQQRCHERTLVPVALGVTRSSQQDERNISQRVGHLRACLEPSMLRISWFRGASRPCVKRRAPGTCLTVDCALAS
jgi:hypothetical protein